MKKQHIDWWQSLGSGDRYFYMHKYGVKMVSDKLIKRMWKGENNEH